MSRLILLFTLVPAVELMLLLAIHSATDLTTTLVIIIGTGILGAALARREGLAILHRLSKDVSSGGFSGHTIVDGTLVAVGGILLLTPGVLTDILGLAMLFPPTRQRIGQYLQHRYSNNFHFHSGTEPVYKPPQPENPFSSPFDD